MSSAGDSAGPPDGFSTAPYLSPFSDEALRPYYRGSRDGSPAFGLRARPEHANVGGTVHGGLIATLADIALGTAIAERTGGARTVTVSMSIDYLRPAAIGEWVEARPRVLSASPPIACSAAEIFADDVRVARAGGTFAIKPQTTAEPGGSR